MSEITEVGLDVVLSFPTKPTGGEGSHHCCACCGVSVEEINGHLEGHRKWCSWRKWVESKRRAIQAEERAENQEILNGELEEMVLDANKRIQFLEEANDAMDKTLADIAQAAGVTDGDVESLLAWVHARAGE